MEQTAVAEETILCEWCEEHKPADEVEYGACWDCESNYGLVQCHICEEVHENADCRHVFWSESLQAYHGAGANCQGDVIKEVFLEFAERTGLTRRLYWALATGDWDMDFTCAICSHSWFTLCLGRDWTAGNALMQACESESGANIWEPLSDEEDVPWYLRDRDPARIDLFEEGHEMRDGASWLWSVFPPSKQWALDLTLGWLEERLMARDGYATGGRA